MTAQAPAHLLIVEPNAGLRDLMREYLKTQRFLVSLARDAAHARRLLAGLDFDLVVMDASAEGAAELVAEVSAPFLLLTAPGAKTPVGCETLAKPFEPKDLVARLDDILDRRPHPEPAGPPVLQIGALTFDIETCTLSRGGEAIRLTATEAQLMRILAKKVDTPVGRGDLIARLGRGGIMAKTRAVDVQITRLRRKIEDDPRNPKHLHTVRGAGYMLSTQ